MAEPIEEEYFNWLCAKVLPPNDRNYRELLRILYETEFVWVIHDDRNRAEDGLELRTFFLNQSGFPPQSSWSDVGCSVLEMFVAFSSRAEFNTETSEADWFWLFIQNLGLDGYRHHRYLSHKDKQTIDDILYNFVWRLYDADGSGGLFPLHRANENQRGVEVWYQFCQYLEDIGQI